MMLIKVKKKMVMVMVMVFGASLDSHLEYRSAEGTPEDPSIPPSSSS